MALSSATINTHVKEVEYAVRGPIVARAGEIDADLKKGAGSYPFKNVIFCNIGNPQALQQKPLSFPREVLALLTAPELLEHPKSAEVFAPDALTRAKVALPKMGGTGAYTHSAGYDWVRQTVASYIQARDNNAAGKELGPADPNAIFLTNGASPGVQMTLQCLINGPSDGIMTPIPQYPLYTATITLMNGSCVPYYLDESKAWGMTTDDLSKAYDEAKSKGITPRALVVINPGNPTGQVLEPAAMADVVKWAHSRNVMLLADEVYQENVYAPGKTFRSFREIMLGLGEPYSKEVQLASFHTTSKGIHGECGRRGGYTEFINVPQDVMDIFIKLPSINLCPNLAGQVMVDLMLSPPKAGDASFESYTKEYNDIYQSLKRRALLLVDGLNKIEGIRSNAVEGAMYAFPSLKLPSKFVDEAKAKGKPADTLWCARLLEEQGVVVVPGSGFGQVAGTYHFRTTILPPEEQMADMVSRIANFQKSIIAKYGPVEA